MRHGVRLESRVILHRLDRPCERLRLVGVADEFDGATIEADVGADLDVAGVEGEKFGVVRLKPDSAGGLDSAGLKLSATAAEAFFVGCHWSCA